MSRNRLIVVADDQRLGQAVLAQLKPIASSLPTTVRFEAISRQVTGRRNGTIVFVPTNSAECDQCFRAVQELRLLATSTALAIVEPEGLAWSRPLDVLDPHIAARFHWPADATSLVRFLEERHPRETMSVGLGEESLADRIRERLMAQTPSLAPMAERLALAASHDVTVLLTGETGTGKTYLAKMLHDSSARSHHRFLVVPCGALSPNLVESEFFGHTKGAFTSADRPKIGKFAAAGDGTLLLDEIDALGLEQQANLLRVIETGEYEAVGSNETQTCTARIVVASNWNLEEAVAAGKFRRDLYYRLNVMSFHLAPLRERVEDIEPLVRGMAARFNHKFRKDLFEVSADALAALEAYPWGGNLRQLENVVQHAILVSSGPRLLPQHLPQAILEHATARSSTPDLNAPNSLATNRETHERSVIQKALMNCGYSRARAAHALGISRVTLYKKMKKYDLMAVPLNPSQAQ